MRPSKAKAMKIAWISLNLIGLTLITGSAVCMPYHKNICLPVLFMGFACSIISNYFRWKLSKKNQEAVGRDKGNYVSQTCVWNVACDSGDLPNTDSIK